MKFTPRVDGTNRVTVSVSHDVTANGISIALLVELGLSSTETAEEVRAQLRARFGTRKQIEQGLREFCTWYGNPANNHFRVESLEGDVQDAAEAHVLRVFGF